MKKMVEEKKAEALKLLDSIVAAKPRPVVVPKSSTSSLRISAGKSEGGTWVRTVDAEPWRFEPRAATHPIERTIIEDQAARDGRKLFVSNVPRWMRERDLAQVLAPCGDVEICYSGFVRGVRQPYAFVCFRSRDAANRALTFEAKLREGDEPLKISIFKNAHETAFDEAIVKYGSRHKVHVAGLPTSITERKVRDFFGTFGEIEEVAIPRSGDGVFVRFVESKAASHVVDQSRQSQLSFEGSVLNATPAVPLGATPARERSRSRSRGHKRKRSRSPSQGHCMEITNIAAATSKSRIRKVIQSEGTISNLFIFDGGDHKCCLVRLHNATAADRLKKHPPCVDGAQWECKDAAFMDKDEYLERCRKARPVERPHVHRDRQALLPAPAMQQQQQQQQQQQAAPKQMTVMEMLDAIRKEFPTAKLDQCFGILTVMGVSVPS